jgi:signal transduction histidine kinase
MPTTTTLAPRARPRVRIRHRIELRLRPELGEVGRARRVVGERLLRWEVGESAQCVLLVVSELVGNALRHGGGGEVGLVVRGGDGVAVVEVRDGSPEGPVLGSGADPYAESGRGLLIVAAVARDWGWAPCAGGKAVWAVVPCAGRGG